MVDSPFSPFSPLKAALSRARSINGDLGQDQQQDTTQQPEQDSAPTVLDRVKQISAQTGIPSNVLYALTEAAGAKDGSEIISGAERAGNTLSREISAGKSLRDALSEAVGSPVASDAILQRANQLADTFDPAGAPDAGRPETGNVLRDVPAGAVSSALTGLGAGARTVGRLIDDYASPRAVVQRVVDPALQALGLQDKAKADAADAIDRQIAGPGVGERIGNAADYLSSGAGNYLDRKLVSSEAKQAAADTGFTDTSNVFQPSTWDLKDESSWRGWMQQGAQVVGSMLPLLLTKSPTTAAGIGGVMGAGDGGTQAEQMIDTMAATPTNGGRSSQLYDESAVYRRLIDSGVPQQDALAQVRRQTADLAAAAQAPLSAAGGALTNRIVRQAEHFVGGLGSRTARTLGGAAISGLEEGSQEVAEGVAAQAGANQGAGTDQSLTDGSMNNFVLGALGGAPMGAAGGALSSQRQPRNLDDVGTTDAPVAGPAQLPAPTNGGSVILGGPVSRQIDPTQVERTTPRSPFGPAPATPQPAGFRPTGRNGEVIPPEQANPQQQAAPTATGPIIDNNLTAITDQTPPEGAAPIQPDQPTAPTQPMPDIQTEAATAMPGQMPPTTSTAQPVPPPVQPIPKTGPLALANLSAPKPMFGAAKAGAGMMIRLKERPQSPIYGQFVAETPVGVRFRDTVTGQQHTIPRQEIEGGDVAIDWTAPARSVDTATTTTQEVAPNEQQPQSNPRAVDQPRGILPAPVADSRTDETGRTAPGDRRDGNDGPASGPDAGAPRNTDRGANADGPRMDDRGDQQSIGGIGAGSGDRSGMADAVSTEKLAADLTAAPKTSPKDGSEPAIDTETPVDMGGVMQAPKDVWANLDDTARATFASKIPGGRYADANGAPNVRARRASKTEWGNLPEDIKQAWAARVVSQSKEDEAAQQDKPQKEGESTTTTAEPAVDQTPAGEQDTASEPKKTPEAAQNDASGEISTPTTDNEPAPEAQDQMGQESAVEKPEMNAAAQTEGQKSEPDAAPSVMAPPINRQWGKFGAPKRLTLTRKAGLDDAAGAKMWSELPDQHQQALSQAYADLGGAVTGTTDKRSEKAPEATNEPKDTKKAGEKGKKIEDFGAVIPGAAKDRAKTLRDMIPSETPDLDAVMFSPLAKVWPEPDYAKLIEDGASPKTVHAIALMRNAGKNKPTRSYDVKYWAQNILDSMSAARKVAAGEMTALDALGDHFSRLVYSNNFAYRPLSLTKAAVAADTMMTLMDGANPAEIGDLSRIYLMDPEVDVRDMSVPADQPRRYEIGFAIRPKSMRINGSGLSFAYSALKADPAAQRQRILASWEASRASRKAANEVPVVLTAYSLRITVPTENGHGTESAQVFNIGFQRAKGKNAPHIKVAGPFKDKAAAEAYLDANRDDLEAEANEIVSGSHKGIEWRQDIRPRDGAPNWRAGKDATDAMFTETFGFHGVQFGKSTTQAEAQARMNDTFDAFMDMAAVMGVPPRAMSLNGTLSLAFGARGKGGRNPAAAHYESGQQIINLTRANGAGTLAHEWFHALDWHLLRVAEKEMKNVSDYTMDYETYGRPNYDVEDSITATRKYVGKKYTPSQTATKSADMEIINISEAAQALRKALGVGSRTKAIGGEWRKRSEDLDKSRAEPYFATTVEMGARGFEAWITQRLEERQMVNDFLSAMDPTSGAYPSPREFHRAGIDSALGEFLDRAIVILKRGEPDGKPRTSDLASILPDYAYRGPKVGQTWTGPAGAQRTIVSINPKWKTFNVRLSDDADPVGMSEEDVETLIDKDATLADPDMQQTIEAVRGAKQASDEAKAETDRKVSRWTAEILRDAEKKLGYTPAQMKALETALDGGATAYLNGVPSVPMGQAAVWLWRESGWAPKNILVRKGRQAFVRTLTMAGQNGEHYEKIAFPKAVMDAITALEVHAIKAITDDAQESQDTNEPAKTDQNAEAVQNAPETSDKTEPAAPKEKPTKKRLTDNLSTAEKDELASLRAQFRNKMRNQLNAGADPEMALIVLKMAGLYIKAGARAFRDMLAEFAADFAGEYTTKQIEPFARQAYMSARSQMRAEGQSLEGMDGYDAVDEIGDQIRAAATDADADRIIGIEPKTEGMPDAASEPTSKVTEEPDNANGEEHDDDGEGNPDLSHEGEIGEGTVEPDAGSGRNSESSGANGGSGDRNADANGNEPRRGVVGSGEDVPEAVKTGTNPGNYVITDADSIGAGTDGQKITANIEAIRIIKALDAENRYPTRDEQAKLAQYVGWGGLKTIFDPKKADATDQWGRAQRELKGLLTKKEYDQAFDSISNAHYTAPGIVRAMWGAMQHFGFAGGRALEPTMGVGNFLGLQPKDLADATEWHGAELDGITSKIAAALYPDANIIGGKGFQDAPFAPQSFDIAIGNPPFGAERINRGRDASLNGMKIHNYIIAKTGTHLRPGGIMAMVVTHRFLDTADAEARDRLAKDFTFMGAIRLPNDAFKSNAGTDVVTDIVFLRKLRAGEEPETNPAWLDTNGKLDGGIRVNRYFAEHPQNILGQSAMDGKMNARTAGNEYTVHSDGRDLTTAIRDLLRTEFAAEAGALDQRNVDLEQAAVTQNIDTMPEGGMVLQPNGKIMLRDSETSIVEVTPDSLWKAEAEEYATAAQSMENLRSTIANAGDIKTAMDGLIRDTSFLYKKGVMRERPTKPAAYLLPVYDLLEGPIPAVWNKKAKEALSALTKAADSRRLSKDFGRLKGMLDLRNKTLGLIRAERSNAPNMEDLRRDLKKAYDAFTAEFGFVNSDPNVGVMRGDVGAELGLEAKYAKKSDTEPESATPSAMLTQRVIFPEKVITSAETPSDGAAISISQRGRIDIPYIASLTGMSEKEVTDDLLSGNSPMAFMDPDTNQITDAETYLSGNVKVKLKHAQDEGLDANVKALQAVQPADLPQEKIAPNIRSMWMPTSVFEDFMTDMGIRNPKASIMQDLGKISLSGDSSSPSDFGLQFQSPHADNLSIMRAAVSGKPIKITYRDSDGKQIVDTVATRDVNAVVERMGREFEKWAYLSTQRAAEIVTAYNKTMNSYVDRKFDGVKYLKTVGMSPLIELRNSQKNGAWRIITSPSSLMHHIVGAGKTFTAIVGVMERKRMGLSQKPMIAVPNHLIAQWASDFRKVYPGANILAAGEKDFELKNRRRLFSRIATGDYDAIIIGHSSLSKIENDKETSERIIQEQVEMLEEALEDSRTSGMDSRTLSQLRKTLASYREKLQKLNDQSAKRQDEIGITFRDMGIDFLTVDEAHEFKNLEYQTAGERLVGMNSPRGSQKAFDLYLKTRYLLDMNEQGNGDVSGLSFLTGTPVSNSLVEVYSMMKYLAPQGLKDMGIAHFDAWSGSFVQAETRFEYNATQKLVERRVMSKMVNLNALSQLYRSFADIILQDKLKEIYAEQMEAENRKIAAANKANGTNLPMLSTKFPIPKVKSGGRVLNSSPASAEQRLFTEYLASRMIGMKQTTDKKAYAKLDNALWVLSDARKASIDMRTIDSSLPRDPTGKVARAAEKVFDLWKRSEKDRGTQLIFSDLSTPKKSARVQAVAAMAEGMRMRDQIDPSRKQLKLSEYKDQISQWASAKESMTDHWSDVVRDIQNALDRPDIKDDVRERGTEWLDQNQADALAAMTTFDTGFSVYDDMKAALIEKGIPEAQIAFIHDYDTDLRKASLFAAVNSGKVRVLMGSTQKMGAGTNVQERLVGEHHMDSPWRPSDVEQREGRIIRQGNKLYEADPDGFEVEINAYSTEGTSDVVLWQVLERKSRAIEDFLRGTADEMEEDAGDADQYAEFMAQSTGNPVFLRKLETERDLLLAEAENTGTLAAKAEAERFMKRYDEDKDRHEKSIASIDRVPMKKATLSGYPHVADPSDFAPAMAAYREKYQKAMDQYRADLEAVENENKERKDAGEKRKPLPKAPDLEAPSPFVPEVLEASSYARLLDDAMSRLQYAREGTTIVIKFDAGDDFSITLKREGLKSDIKKSDFTATANLRRAGSTVRHIVLGSNRVMTVKSSSLPRNLTPASLQYFLKDERDYLQSTLDQMKKDRPEMERRSKIEVDTTKERTLRGLLDYYAAAVSLAEARRDFEISKRPRNKYEIMDTVSGRIFGSDMQGVIQKDLSFTLSEGSDYDGNYEGDGIGVKPNAFSNVEMFEGKNTETGADGIFEIVPRAIIKDLRGDIRPDDDIVVSDPDYVALRFMANPQPNENTEVNPDLVEKSRRKDGANDRQAPMVDIDANMPEAVSTRLAAEMARFNIDGRVSLQMKQFLQDRVGRTVFGVFQRLGRGVGIVRIGTGDGERQAIDTLRHEIIHALRDPAMWERAGGNEFGLFSRDEWTALVRAGRADREIVEWANAAYKDDAAANITEEIVAEFFAKWARQQDERQSGTLSKALTKMRDMLLSIFRAIAPSFAPKVSGAEVMRKIMEGRIGGRGNSPTPSPVGPGRRSTNSVPSMRIGDISQRVADQVKEGTTTQQVADAFMAPKARVSLGFGRTVQPVTGRGLVEQGKSVVEWGRDVVKYALTQAMSGNFNLLATVPGRALFEELAANLPHAKTYLRAKEAMDSLRNKWQQASGDTANAWFGLSVKDRASNETLMDIMHESTRFEIDPTESFTSFATAADRRIVNEIGMDERAADTPEKQAAQRAVRRDKERKAAYDSVTERYAALPQEFKVMFTKIRDTYRKMRSEYDAAMSENITKAAAITVRRADRALMRRLDEIESDPDMTNAEKDEAVAIARAAHKTTVANSKQGAAARRATLRKMFESGRLRGAYFPLSRFGDFFVTARNENHEVVSFSRFTTARAQQAEAARLKALGYKITHGVLDTQSRRQQVDPRFVADVENMLSGTDVPAEVMDAIWQRWLDTLPDISVRHSAQHRKATPGYQKDALKAFSSSIFHSAHQLARFKYGIDMTDALEEMQVEALAAKDPNKAGLVVNEIAKRHEFIMSPTGSPIVAKLSGLAFAWYLGVTPAAAIVNLTQTSIVGIPMLSTLSNKGAGAAALEASAAIAKASRDFLNKKMTTLEGANVTAEEKVAMQYAYDTGVIDKTQAHDLAGLGDAGTGYSPIMAKAMNGISFLFHHTERANREITYLAAYRMAKDNGQSSTQAMETAARITWKTHFDYQNTSRPRFMQNDAAKFFLQFRNFQINMIYRLFRDMNVMFKGETPELRREARRQLLGITGMMMMHAGISGTWLFGVTMMIAGLFFGGGADEAEDEFKGALVDLFGPTIGGSLWYGVLGQMTGIDLTSRIGMADLWFRSPDRQLEGKDEYEYWLSQLAGPTAGIVGSMFSASQMFSDGNTARGLETMMPKQIKDILKAYRYETDGVQTMKGDPLLNDVSNLDVMRQLMGFTPADISERYQINSSLMNAQSRIITRRQKIMSRAAKAIMDGKVIDEKTLADMAQFNKEYPEYPITAKSLKQSIGARRRQRENMTNGISLNSRLRERLLEEAPPTVND